jgi:hypothetical protein
MIDGDDIHRRHWRDMRGVLKPAIPVRGYDIVAKGGERYAVLKDVDGRIVAAYEVVERLFAAKVDLAVLSSRRLYLRSSNALLIGLSRCAAAPLAGV